MAWVLIRSFKKQRQSFCLLYFFSMQTLTATVWAAQTTTKWLGALEAICGDGPRRPRRLCSIRYLWAHLSYPWVYLLSRPTRTLSLYTNCKCNLDFRVNACIWGSTFGFRILFVISWGLLDPYGGLNGSLKVGEPGVGPTPPSPPQQKAESLRLHFCFWKNVC